jgi:GT2 family glycosyltransferase
VETARIWRHRRRYLGLVHLRLPIRIEAAYWVVAAEAAAIWRPRRRAGIATLPRAARPRGISVVIPSRNGRELLHAQLPGVVRQLGSSSGEIIVVDNGSDDGTSEWLAANWPQTRVAVSPEPLSFARAVNRGIAIARYSHVCLLNNDMLVAPGFFQALEAAFQRVPELFCATAQIRFPPGIRREETGKAVLAPGCTEGFPVRCEEPLPGEDYAWVLYGSGGCSLYDAAKLQALGNADEAYEPAYVEDLDLGWRAWQRGWPSVYVSGALVEHRHRATTSRYFTSEELEFILELNYLRFLARAVEQPGLFHRLWTRTLRRLRNGAVRPALLQALRRAWRIARSGRLGIAPEFDEEWFAALTDGSVAVFPGTGEDRVLVASVQALAPPPPSLLREYAEITLVRGPRESLAFRAAVKMARHKWPSAACEGAEGLPGTEAKEHS